MSYAMMFYLPGSTVVLNTVVENGKGALVVVITVVVDPTVIGADMVVVVDIVSGKVEADVAVVSTVDS
ncbi:unnamed protein product [Haemonchus placei]|uniref:Uncharacterized protein n=1 Tax=Haemonchus placei TaxID=6290 RepID=A0A0N4VSW3_HAEPC|nr:unnamed protein product [Haemonchus placei]VDO10925.1 unnamed protein product [Haemonchus placei]